MTEYRTRQEIFDIVVKHLLTQNRKSQEEEFGCLYRGPDGLKCAVGALIPDDKYSDGLEGATAHAERVCEAAGYHPMDTDFVNELQVVHDTREPSEWKKLLKLKGESYNLTWPEGF